ncbi:uncharacterized protein LOC116428720 isoform X2 [Nomia melanderi]|uniref:uncharacterized protein LOC116428720 isoform X2 n=2 Tax=Nomia melanderi TaxID=2448451 RepID=UPI0013045E3F|nr:uncharacterized protein LOC116428720 isoform X1 [Nomia melanderi]
MCISAMMEDQELIKLRNLKTKLLKEANDLVAKLKQQEIDGQKCFSTTELESNTLRNVKIKENKLHEHVKHTFCEVTCEVMGIRFENIDREWLNNNIYKYIAEMITSALQCILELTVKIEGENEFEIQNITCHFIGLNNCYLLEIQSWVQNISRLKNFALLMSAISQYSTQSESRRKILARLKKIKYATYKPCRDKNGGITVFIHSPENVKQIYLQFQWSLLFLEQTWQSGHFFNIYPTSEGINFTNENQNLLTNFCEKSIADNELVHLWQKLCNAVDLYENKNKNDIVQDTKGQRL